MDSDIDALLWQRRPRPSRGPKPGLSLERIIAEAVTIADTEGLEGLSMKRLAAKLDSGVMSLYRYVPGKDELIELMLDAVYADPPEIPDGMPWREAVRKCAVAMRAFFLAHPWALPVSTRAHAIGPNETGWVEAQLRAIAPLNAPPELGLHLILVISGFVRGAVPPELSVLEGKELRFTFVENHPETHERFPLLSRTLKESAAEREREYSTFFDFGLDRMLDGIAADFDTTEDPPDPE